ncbi:hypothetical protein K1T71_012342 [Dendrolimus kikuchii]|uniref:Uncharacterized protein n=1 Tax=Dendrolimus kikuchii TaxID=765133 RepID=A0ACC1CLA2_9NEOP|nr:hypothetical protein K1T71_012342 [Dendrolimus kikuchii]
MQFTDLFCYAVLTLTVTSSCVYSEEQKPELETQSGKRIAKRDAAVLIDGYPIEPMYLRPKVIYQRISKQRYGPPSKTRYGSTRPKYGASRISRKPTKKYRGKKPYGPSGYKKRTIKPRESYPKWQKPLHGAINKIPHYSYYPPKHVESSFGEPPSDYDLQHLKPKYVIAPIDSYGEPIKTTVSDLVTTTNSFVETTPQYDNPDANAFDQELWQNFEKDKGLDSSFALSKKIPSFLKTDSDMFITPAPDFSEDNLKSYSDIYTYRQNGKEIVGKSNKKKLQYIPDNSKSLNRPWRAQRKPERDEVDEAVVGGQYAEPPARYFEKYQPMFSEDNDFNPPRVYRDMRIMTARRSPYVNYKNSNMAFSPQNLNDAFSINKK